MRLDLIAGNGDVVGTLEEVTELARNGRLIGVVICGILDDEMFAQQIAWREDLPAPYAMLLGSVASAQHDLLQNGLEPSS